MRMWELRINADSIPGRLRYRFRSVLATERAAALLPMHHLRTERPGR